MTSRTIVRVPTVANVQDAAGLAPVISKVPSFPQSQAYATSEPSLSVLAAPVTAMAKPFVPL